MKDNIEQEVSLGDYVFCLTGKNKNQIMQVKSFRVIHEYYGDIDAVNFIDNSWLHAENIISLTSLGVQTFSRDKIKAGYTDALGNLLHEGDQVLYVNPMDVYAEIGNIKKLSSKTCLLQIKKNRLGQTEYRKKYEEIISLTAIGKEDLTIEHHFFD